MSEKGNISIILAVAIAVLMGVTAFVVDIGLLYAERIKTSNALDAAVLAGVMELPEKKEKAKEVAGEYLIKNNVDLDYIEIIISEENDSVSINSNKEINHIFAKVFGIDKNTVKVGSKAIIGPAKSVNGGIRPFAVEKFDYSYGEIVTLKASAGDGYNGNYGAIALGGRGASVFRDNVITGYDGTLKVGDIIDTEPGNMASVINYIQKYIDSDLSTFDNIVKNSTRMWTIPLVNTLELNGRDEVEVVGFAQFFVEDIGKQSGQMDIKGRFIRYVTKGEIDMELEDTGAYGSKLGR